MLGVICQLCRQRPACLHVTEQVPASDGTLGTRSLDICHTCLSERDIDDDSQLPSIDQLLSDGDGQVGTQLGRVHAPSEQRCPHCSLSMSQFATSKRFGCAHDYDVFGDTIIPLLDEFHGASHHIGRVPSERQDVTAGEAFRHRLDCERQLQEAIAREDYEQAARLRDVLRELDR